MIIHKIFDTLRFTLNIMGIGSSKRKSFKVLKQPAETSYGQKHTRAYYWFMQLKKRVSSIPIFKKKRYDLSRSEKRKILWRKLVKVGLALTLFMVVLTGLKKPLENFASSVELFQIKEISINGCHRTKPADIKALAGFDYNTSMFHAAPALVSKALLENPWIRSAKVTRQWPNGISIEIKEHEVTAMLVMGSTDGERFFYVNRDGESIAAVQIGEDIDYPVITGFNDISQMEQASALQDATALLKLIGSNDPNLPAQSVSEIHLDTSDGMVVHLVEFPFPIYFGKGDVKKKYKRLRKVLAVLYKKRNKSIDISQVEYIRMDYLENKVLISQTESG